MAGGQVCPTTPRDVSSPQSVTRAPELMSTPSQDDRLAPAGENAIVVPAARVAAHAGGLLQLSDAASLDDAQFVQAGLDLVITTADGAVLVLEH